MAVETNRTRFSFPRKNRRKWGYIALFVLLVALILPKDFVPEYSYELGKTWVAPALSAEFDFTIPRDPSELQEERERAKEAVPPVFEVIPEAKTVSQRRINDALDSLSSHLQPFGQQDPDFMQGIRQSNFLSTYQFDPEDFLKEIGGKDRLRNWMVRFREKANRFVERVYDTGLMDTSRAALGTPVVYVRTSEIEMEQTELILERRDLAGFLPRGTEGLALSTSERLAFKNVVFPKLLPNLRYSPRLTARERVRAEQLVSPVVGKVRRGEQIIAEGEQVRESTNEKLKAYLKARQDRFGTRPYMVTYAGQLQLVLIFTFLLVLFLRTNRPRIWRNERKLLLVLTLILIMVLALVLVLRLTTFTQELAGLNYIYLAPVCMVAIILSIFFDARFAFFGNLLVALFAGSIVPNGFEYIFVQICGGTAAVYSITRMRNRADFFVALSLILLTYTISYLSYNFYIKGSFSAIPYGNLILFLLNGLLTLVTYPLIYLFERIFGLNSDITFIELLDTNHPLLSQLAVRAPGTFHHSLQVANIAEAVINKIGGNGLQVKVGAYFHDIGKMANPQYFIENQSEGNNPHGQLSPVESAQIIIDHVTEGVRLAQEYSLPTEVIDFIKTHHGTTTTFYFLKKHQEAHPDEEIDESQFSYPGPLPFSKEMSVLMMADSVEAASRSLKDPEPAQLKALVDKIIDGKMNQRQFSRSELTFKDLENAKEVMYKMLVSIYHGRIEYPEEAKNPEPQSGKAPS